jgi:hypothetical protein
MYIFFTIVLIIYCLNILITFKLPSKTVVTYLEILRLENLHGEREGMHVHFERVKLCKVTIWKTTLQEMGVEN